MKRKHTLSGGGIGFLLALFGLGFNAAALEVISNVTATASATRSGSGPASAVVDGSGLVGNAHDTEELHIWYSGTRMDLGITTFRVDLQDTYPLRRIDVWNCNHASPWGQRRSVKRANVYVSTSNPGATAPGAGAPWVLVHENYYFNIAPGTVGYLPNTFVDMDGVKARYVGFKILSIHGEDSGFPNQFPGLSELRFYADPPKGTVLLIQ